MCLIRFLFCSGTGNVTATTAAVTAGLLLWGLSVVGKNLLYLSFVSASGCAVKRVLSDRD